MTPTEQRVNELIFAGAEDRYARMGNAARTPVCDYVIDLFVDGLTKSEVMAWLACVRDGDDAALGAMIRRDIEIIIETAVEMEVPTAEERQEQRDREDARDRHTDYLIQADKESK